MKLELLSENGNVAGTFTDDLPDGLESAEVILEHGGKFYVFDDVADDTVYYKETPVIGIKHRQPLRGDAASGSLYGREIG